MIDLSFPEKEMENGAKKYSSTRKNENQSLLFWTNRGIKLAVAALAMAEALLSL